MNVKTSYDIRIRVETSFIPEQSTPDDDQYVFAYTITITNRSSVPVTLLRRHWVITDANNNVREVRGDGVVGEQPHLSPGQSFRYTSGAILETPVGCMEGSYSMVADNGFEFDAPIPAFRLSKPRILN
ncbi:MAG: Co2+/Mg2+ efflux protein ApaG [Gammaproteobacteria bacterium]|nr:Co2+/Mg2+ efflux protein ApaG [Gammaproteobacteria bacterium]